jgi:hypothetical protein
MQLEHHGNKDPVRSTAYMHASEKKVDEVPTHQPCTPVTPLCPSVETYGHLGQPIMWCLRTLSDTASARSLAVTPGSFLASAHRELSVALVQIQGYAYRSCALLPAMASGRLVLTRADTPSIDGVLCRPRDAFLLAELFLLRLFIDALVSVYSLLSFLIIVFAFRALVNCYGST